MILILSGALLSIVAGVIALRAWLSFRRTRLALQQRLSEDVARLAARTGELEEGLAVLDARSQQLPVHISQLQENLVTLRILTRTLSVSLRQTQRILSYSGLKTFSAERVSDLFATLRESTEPQR